MKTILLVILLLALPYCTKKQGPPKDVVELDHKIEKMQKDLQALDTKLKMAMDHGLQIQVTHERELLNSRLEREKERIRKMWPKWDKEQDEKALAKGSSEGGH